MTVPFGITLATTAIALLYIRYVTTLFLLSLKIVTAHESYLNMVLINTLVAPEALNSVGLEIAIDDISENRK